MRSEENRVHDLFSSTVKPADITVDQKVEVTAVNNFVTFMRL